VSGRRGRPAVQPNGLGFASRPQGQITSTDREIDRLVYELYGLTEEEIRIVEEATA